MSLHEPRPFNDPNPPPPATPQDKGRKRSYRTPIIILLIALAVIAAVGIASRIHDKAQLKSTTRKAAILNIVTLKAAPGPDSEDITLPGNIEAWHEAPIYAHTSGYLKDWKVDIGAQVKEGDTLAEIDTPDIDAQFHQAQADLATAVANNRLAQTTASRWRDLLKTGAVSKQEADEKLGDAAAKAAMVASAQANLDRLQQQEDFRNVAAPFAGTVTARNTDVGALISSGNGGAGQELFRIADMTRLRVYVQVPENYALAIQDGMTADLHLPAYPDKTFTATLERTADAIDPATRTLLAQFVVDNSDDVLKSGGYAEAHLHVPSTGNNIHLPVNTLLFHDGMQAAIVEDNHIVLKKVTIGRDYGKEVEIVSGIAEGDIVVVNPPDSMENGQQVHIVAPDDATSSADNGKKSHKKDNAKSAAPKEDTVEGRQPAPPQGVDDQQGKDPQDKNEPQPDGTKDDGKQ